MGDGTKENPYTREDVDKAIEENGGTAKGLDLSEKYFEDDINLRGLDLKGIILQLAHLERANLRDAHLEGAFLHSAHLKGASLWDAHLEGAHLEGAHLEGADLGRAHLEKADLWDAHLEGARLWDAHLEGADLWEAYLEGADLEGAQFSPDTKLAYVRWGNFILGEEKDKQFDRAVATYRRLKIWYTNASIYDTAGEFVFREMTARRKAMMWWPNPIPRLWSKFLSLIYGYGQRPLRIIAWTASVIVDLALIYFIIGSVWEWWAFWRSLYFSAVSFIALGYGSWVNTGNDWIRGIGVFEAFIGVFTMILFPVTLTQKMTR